MINYLGFFLKIKHYFHHNFVTKSKLDCPFMVPAPISESIPETTKIVTDFCFHITFNLTKPLPTQEFFGLQNDILVE